MSDRIHELIEKIGGKVTSLKDQVSTENSKNQLLQSEIEGLKQQLSAKDEELNELKVKNSELERSIQEAGAEEVIVAGDSGVSKEQIDELVKEIDYCIEQLKK